MIIRLNSIEIFAHHGVYEEEIDHGNHFEIDIEVEVSDSFGSSSDTLSNTLDYTQLYKTVNIISENHRYNLLESFAHDICKKILEEFSAIDNVVIRVRKLNPPMGGSVKNVEVELQLSRQ